MADAGEILPINIDSDKYTIIQLKINGYYGSHEIQMPVKDLLEIVKNHFENDKNTISGKLN